MSVTQEQAETYSWWSGFLEARMIAIQSMLALGRTESEIYSSIGVSSEQTVMLIDEARRRQSTDHTKERQEAADEIEGIHTVIRYHAGRGGSAKDVLRDITPDRSDKMEPHD